MPDSPVYAVVLPLTPLPVGVWIDRAAWPLHVTLVSNFESAAGSDLLVGLLREAAQALPPLSGTVGDEAWFGPGHDVLVDLVESESLRGAHEGLLGALERHAGAAPVAPAVQREGYRPHATVARTGRARRGERLRFDRIALVEVGAGGRPDLAVPLALFDLPPSPTVPPTIGAPAALGLVGALSSADVRCWVIGGWGVDALLGEVTREHHDLDVLVAAGELPRLLASLDAMGLTIRHLWSENRWIGPSRLPSAFVADGVLGELDVHVVRMDSSGPVPLSASAAALPAGALEAVGTIAGNPVRCATAEAQLLLHTGYALPAHHRADVERLRALG